MKNFDTTFDIAPLTFHDKNYGEMMYIYPDTKHPWRGWLLRKSKKGNWIAVRKATDKDIERMSAMVIGAHHSPEPSKP